MSGLEILRLTLLVIHLLGLAAIIGPFLLQLRSRGGYRFGWMFAGSLVQLATGVALVAVRRAADLDITGPKIGVKLALAIMVATVMAVAVALQRRRTVRGVGDGGLRPLLYIGGLAATANVAVAVLWR